MAIRDESYSTATILGDASFHRGALLAGAATADLAPPVTAGIKGLREARNAAEEAEELASERLGGLLVVDAALDDLLRELELDVLKAVKKVRASAAYKEVWPTGLTALVALRGQEQVQASGATLAGLAKHHPELHAAWMPRLEPALLAVVPAETAWKAAASAESQASLSERIARADLVRILRKNEGSLTALFPGRRAAVRSYFRATGRKKTTPPTP